MGTEFTKLKDNETHNVDIAYDYRFFFDCMRDNIHKDCIQYIQPYKIEPNQSDKKVLMQYFDVVSNQNLNTCAKQMDINASLRCYCLDGLLIRYLNNSNDDNINNSSNAIELLLIDSIQFMLMDASNVSLAESLFGMNAVWMLPFHHILQYLSSHLNQQIETYIFNTYNIIGKKEKHKSFVDKMNEKTNLDDNNIMEMMQEIEIETQAAVGSINYEMMFSLLHNNALRNQSKQNYDLLNQMMIFHQDQNNEALSLKYIPVIALYRDSNDILFISSLLNKGLAHKSWFAAMEAVRHFPDPQFWDYLVDFFKKIYTHISLVNGETVPQNLEQSLQLQHKQHNKHQHMQVMHACAYEDDEGEDEKDDIKYDEMQDTELLNEGQLAIEGNDNEDKQNESDNDDVVYNNDDNMDYNSLIDESQYYDISTQMIFIKTLCVFTVSNPRLYSEKVCACIHHLLDIPKANTNDGYYEENMLYLLTCIPLHASMRSIILRIWQVYEVCDWRYLNELIHESSLTQMGFKQFLMGTNKRIGKQSNILKIAGERGILKYIYSFLKDEIYENALQLLQNYDNIIWWSAISEESKYIMETLKCVNNLFGSLIRIEHKERRLLYQKFKQKHNTRITEKFVFSRFDPILL